ncbi:LysR family transcriptional regulator [Clostridium sp. MCC353]|uniref:LysR family transcriptional regulator n=1 Tax=Clostridium sp. MCC353 TaxID=2592646 RepID=UPI001C01D8A9|nr:LysR family transcriptional regulator [Clostridium sp. MCC353]MBT9778459.1 LysR family transcriptional regulator [Clostridium sp. MCC353]
MDIKYLNYILAIDRYKSITRAAKALSISQPTLSQYLSKLEEELGAALFLRHDGELYPTPSGRIYLAACRDIQAMEQNFKREAALLIHSEHIRLVASISWALKLLCHILPIFKKEFPECTLEFSEETQTQIKKMMEEGKADIALMAATSLNGMPGCNQILGEEEILFAVHGDHPFCRLPNPERQITPEDIGRYFAEDHFILAAENSNVRRIEEQLFRQINFFPASTCRIKHMHHAAAMVSKAFGVTMLPASCALPSPAIRYYRLNPRACRINFISRQACRPLTPGEEMIISLIQEYYPMFQPPLSNLL